MRRLILSLCFMLVVIGINAQKKSIKIPEYSVENQQLKEALTKFQSDNLPLLTKDKTVVVFLGNDKVDGKQTIILNIGTKDSDICYKGIDAVCDVDGRYIMLELPKNLLNKLFAPKNKVTTYTVPVWDGNICIIDDSQSMWVYLYDETTDQLTPHEIFINNESYTKEYDFPAGTEIVF